MKLRQLILLTTSVFILISCSNKRLEDTTTYDILPGEIYEISAKESIELGETITIKVKFNGGTNGCALPGHLRFVQYDFSISIQAFYKYPKEVRPCTMAIPQHTLTHDFKPIKKGEYTIQASNNSEVKTVITVW